MCPYHLKNGWVAADDEGQTAEALDAMGDPHRQLLVKVLGTALGSHTYTHSEKLQSVKALRLDDVLSVWVKCLPRCGVHQEISQNTAGSLRSTALRPADTIAKEVN